MRTFAQKPKATQQTTSAKPTIPARAHFGQSREVNSVLHLQRTIGNQTVQRLLETDTGDIKRDSTTTGFARFSHDFSRIPLHSKAPVRLQAKLTVNTPGDIYEQEADRVSEQVMRMPEPQRTCACGGGCPACQNGQLTHEHLQTKHDHTHNFGEIAAPPIVHEVLRSSGQPLDTSTREFMESRFGHDFSRVRVHNNARASESARAVNALAYSVGRDIVFSNERYQPGTTNGRHLLAHELTHVIQQSPNVVRQKPVPAGDAANAVQVGGLTSTSALVQRALNCDIDHVTNACAGADASCMAVQGDYCAKKYPGAKEIESLHKNAVAGAESQKADIPSAAGNLLYFLAGSGKEKVMPVDIFKKHSVTQDLLLNTHRNKFIEGAVKRLKNGQLKLGGSVDLKWTDTGQAFQGAIEDLALSVGGFTLCSNVQVTATDKGSGNVELTFNNWTVQAFDCYNWDPGKGIGNLFGGVNDKDLCCLQNAGKGKHFRIRTDPWKNDYAPSFAKETISTSSPPPPPKSGGSKEKDDDR